jgi:hypothetical protein
MPFIVNIASSVDNTWHKMLGSSVVLHRIHREIGGEDYCHLAIALVQVFLEEDTTAL